VTLEQAIAAARGWIAADPDPETRRELQGYIDDESKHGLLLEVMSGSLKFGTAGLRAIVGPGPLRMNRAVIRRTTAGVARYLKQRVSETGAALRPVVVGRDARTSSAPFQAETIDVFAAHGVPVRFFRDPVPTPIAAYAARRLEASAAVVITASHNPAEYNGYKLYGADAVQIVPPADEAVAREIERSAPAVRETIAAGAEPGGPPGIEPVPEALIEDYYDDVARLRPDGAPGRDLCIVYTPMHGVGAVPVERVLWDAGFTRVHVVPAQRVPDGRFPTVSFPNPEEPGALDLATELARELNADLLLANDPDVDRLAASVPDDTGGWVALTGNQIGILLADFALERAPASPQPMVVQSVVSSPMLRTLARAHGATLEQTLTGFKWVWTAALARMAEAKVDYVFGYEEALGYAPGQFVRDKDGISSALLLSELAALERSRGRTLRERLADLYRRHGLWVSVQRSVTRPGLKGEGEIATAMDRLSVRPPERVLDAAVSSVTDYRTGGERRARWLGDTNLLELTLGERGRILVRPSGTEPKLKIYVDLRRALAPLADVWQSERELVDEARALASDMTRQLGFD
jgi:phosphomannomutase